MSNQNQEVSFVVQNALHNNDCQTMPYLLIILVCILVQFQQGCIGIELCHMDLKVTDNIHITCTIITSLFIILTKLHQFVSEAYSTLKNTTEQNNRKGQTWTHTHTHTISSNLTATVTRNFTQFCCVFCGLGGGGGGWGRGRGEYISFFALECSPNFHCCNSPS